MLTGFHLFVSSHSNLEASLDGKLERESDVQTIITSSFSHSKFLSTVPTPVVALFTRKHSSWCAPMSPAMLARASFKRSWYPNRWNRSGLDSISVVISNADWRTARGGVPYDPGWDGISLSLGRIDAIGLIRGGGKGY